MSMSLQGIFMGVAATVVIDGLAIVLKNVFGLPTAHWGLVGRWVGHLRDGRFVHRAISDAEPVAGETAIGWLTHYAVGSIYGVGYLWIMAVVLGRSPDLRSAAVFGLVTLAAPWLILQPALGVGMFASRAPKPWVVRGVNILIHLVFGVSLYLGWRALG